MCHEPDMTAIQTTSSAVGRKSPVTTINDLPEDILLIIFCELLYDIRKPVAAFPRKPGVWPSCDNSMMDPPFPESIATVHPLWGQAMSAIAAFWARLVIWVGRGATPLSRVKQYLEWSQSQNLDIYILQKPQPLDFVDAKAEVQHQVAAVMQLLTPHISRWSLLRVQLHYASTLPRPRFDLVGRAENLETLRLEFAVDDVTESYTTTSEFYTPELTALSMPGLHYRQAYVDPRPSMPPLLRSLTLSKYSPLHPTFAAVDLLRSLMSCEDLQSLDFDGLDLDCSYTGPPLVRDVDPTPSNGTLSFTNMDTRTINELDRLLDYPYLDVRSYTRCTGASSLVTYGPSCELRLKDIAEPVTLSRLLCAVEGQASCNDAVITDCDGVNASTFAMLSKPMSELDRWPCQRLAKLRIERCRQFTSGDLRKCAQVRREMHAASGYMEEHVPGFVVASLLKLHVRDCCELAEEDKKWFDDNVADITWDDWQGGYSGRNPI